MTPGSDDEFHISEDHGASLTAPGVGSTDDDNWHTYGGEAVELSESEDDVPDGQWVVSKEKRGRVRTLHKVGLCWRIPGVHYSSYELVSADEIRDAGPNGFGKTCKDCFKGLESKSSKRPAAQASQNSSSSSGSSSDSSSG